MPPPGNQYLESRGAWVPELGYVLHLKPERLKELEADLWSGSVCSEAVAKVPERVRR